MVALWLGMIIQILVDTLTLRKYLQKIIKQLQIDE